MISKVTLPKFDANMEEGTVGSWLKGEGDTINKSDPLVEIVTDKTTYEIQSPASGILRQIIAPEKSIICTGYIMAFIADENEQLPDVTQENSAIMEQFNSLNDSAPLDTAPIIKKQSEPKSSSKVRATPSAKTLASENGISLDDVQQKYDAKVVNEKLVLQYLEETK
jgi:pyruvate dehydrogenase E2 component (dihydrolipoamide acetyltransferase)